MTKQAQATALGIPDRSEYGDTTKLPIDQLLNYVVQEHDANRAGKHLDLRFGQDQLHSWAVPKGMPEPGERRLAVQQPLHEGQYSTFEGEIPKGEYGAGTVKTHDKGSVLVTKAQPGQVNFVVAHRKYPERYSLIRTKGKNWLLVNTTPVSSPALAAHRKEHYKIVPQKDVEKVLDGSYAVSAKIDGACLDGTARIMTDRGELPIKTIVDGRLPVQVISRDSLGNLCWRRVTNYWRYEKTEDWISIRYWTYPRRARYLSCTPGHKILSTEGMRHAAELTTSTQVYAISQVPNQQLREVILGGLLGDGHLTKEGSFSFLQAEPRHGLVNWLYQQFVGSGRRCACLCKVAAARGMGRKPTLRMKSSRMFYELRDRLYGDMADKQFTLKDLADLTPLAAAIWFAGDGTLATGYSKRERKPLHRVELCTHSFTEDTLNALVDKLHQVFGVHFIKRDVHRESISRKGRPQKTLVLGRQEEVEAFIREISPFLHPCVAYKLRRMPDELQQLVGTALAKVNCGYVPGFTTTTVDLIRRTEKDKGHWRRARAEYVYDLEVEDTHNYVAEGIVVSNSALFQVLKDHIEALSYRTDKEGRPIIHTHRIPGMVGLKIPRSAQGTVLRGELFAEQGGKAIPAQQLGGLLNASVENSRRRQQADDIQMRAAIFKVLQEGGKLTDPATPPEEQIAKIQRIVKVLPQEIFTTPPTTTDPAEARKLWEQIKGGKLPLTSEGIVATPLKGGTPSKVKLLNEHDVYIRDIFPAVLQGGEPRAGGFKYSLEPGGPIVGEVGTGFSHELAKAMLANPNDYIGRTARVRAQGQFPKTKALRAPALLSLHEDEPQMKTAAAETVPGIPDVRQHDGKSCGATALQAVIAASGKDVRIDQLKKETGTTANGAKVEALVSAAKKHGLDARKEKLTVDSLKRLLKERVPVLVSLQAWPEEPQQDFSDDHQDGHYMVAIGAEKNQIIFEDPSTFGRVYLTDEQLRNRWHDDGESNIGIVFRKHKSVDLETPVNLEEKERAELGEKTAAELRYEFRRGSVRHTTPTGERVSFPTMRIVAVAEKDGKNQTVGLAEIIKDFHGKPLFRSFQVNPEWRKQGIGREMLGQLLAKADQELTAPLYTRAEPSDDKPVSQDKLMALYGEFGFKPTGKKAKPFPAGGYPIGAGPGAMIRERPALTEKMATALKPGLIMSLIDKLRQIKQLSDLKKYQDKHEKVRQIVVAHPEQFYIDSEDAATNIVGVTHRPSGFRFHVPQNVVGDVLKKETAPVIESVTPPPAGAPLINVDVTSPTGEKKASFRVEVAEGEEAARKGLGGRPTMPDSYGMLFKRAVAFWMRGCNFDLDIAFLRKDGTVLEIQQMKKLASPDEDPEIYQPAQPADLAVELPFGWCQKNNVKPGDRLLVRV